MRQVKSIISNILQDIYNAKSYEDAKKLLINTIDSSRINPDSKLLMRANVRDIEDKYHTDKSRLQALQVYATNSMFSKLGMSDNKVSSRRY